MIADADRRILSNLSIPMNPDEIAVRLQGITNHTAEDVDGRLRELHRDGLVVKVEGDDAAHLASVVQNHKHVLDFTDERAEIYARRMSAARFRWRTLGDLWILSNEGLVALHAPLDDEPGPKTPSEIQALVDETWANTIKGEYDPEKHSLGGSFLEHEFTDWFNAVADECERVWNERPVAPIAGGASGYSDAYEISLLDAENQKTGLGAVVDPWYMALSILSFNDTDTGTTADDGSHKPTYTGYARKSVAGTDMNAASGTSGSVTNANAITFAACTSGSSVIVALANTSASTLGTLRKYADSTGSVTVSTTQTPPQFGIGAYTTTVA